MYYRFLCALALFVMGGVVGATEAWAPAAAAKQAERGALGDPSVMFLHDGDLVEFDGSGFDWGLVPASFLVTYNNGYPWGRYDGQLWQGRGFNLVSRAGVFFDGPVAFAQVAPEWGYSENRDFRVGPDYYNGAVDVVGRFGEESFSFLGWGQSFVGVRYQALSLRLSTENLWFGPAYENPLLWGTEAPGFPHASLNLARTETSWGTFEATALLGYLEASQGASNDAYDGKRALWGLMLGYSPPGVEGLTLGATRSIISAWNQVSAFDFARLFLPSIPGDQDQTDQRFSLVARYRFPQTGFEVYTEWARNDFSPGFVFILKNPFHSAAWTGGFFHRLRLAGVDLGYGAEFTDLTLPLEHLNNRWGYSTGVDFYTHGILREGYTNQGQLLGASIGNGSNRQSARVVWYLPEGEVGLSMERWHRDASYFYSDAFRAKYDQVLWERIVDVELSWGVAASWRVGDWEIDGSWRYMKELSRYYEPKNYLQVHPELRLTRSF